MKPPALVAHMIGNSCPEDGLVFDRFRRGTSLATVNLSTVRTSVFSNCKS